MFINYSEFVLTRLPFCFSVKMFCTRLITNRCRPIFQLTSRSAATHNPTQANWGQWEDEKEKISKWTALNQKVFEPLKEGEEERPAVSKIVQGNDSVSIKGIYIHHFPFPVCVS